MFSHDERLPEAVRRPGIDHRLLAVTRRPGSVVEVTKSLEPVLAHIEDARALAYTADLPGPVKRRLLPFCLARRSLGEGGPRGAGSRVHRDDSTENAGDRPLTQRGGESLARAGTLTTLAALAIFDDREKGSEVMARLNKFGGWAGDAFKGCKEGAHQEYAGDIQLLMNDSERLVERIQAL